MNDSHETAGDGMHGDPQLLAGQQLTVGPEVPVGQQLMAYLDGELDVGARRRIEEVLSGNTELRQQLKEMQQTWDLLDDLPRGQVDESFTRTTVEMVAIRADEEANRRVRNVARWRLAGICMGILAGVVAGIAGFSWVTSRLAAPNRQLVEDLPILERLDAYQNAGSIEFLELLDQEGLFQEDADAD